MITSFSRKIWLSFRHFMRRTYFCWSVLFMTFIFFLVLFLRVLHMYGWLTLNFRASFLWIIPWVRSTLVLTRFIWPLVILVASLSLPIFLITPMFFSFLFKILLRVDLENALQRLLKSSQDVNQQMWTLFFWGLFRSNFLHHFF